MSFLKAQSYQDAHPGNSNPLDEQAFVVNVVNTLEQSPFWNSTAVIIAYDDSDGWYDHQPGTDHQRFVFDLGFAHRSRTPAERREPRRIFPVRTPAGFR